MGLFDDPAQQGQQQVIPSGPTVSPQPFSTNGLADVLNLVIPALVGSQMTRYNPNGTQSKAGGLGAMAGIGYGEEAMQDQRKRAQAYRQAEEENKYRQAVTREAALNSEKMELATRNAALQMAERDKTLESIKDPVERQLFLNNPDEWVKQKKMAASKPGDVQFLVTASRGGLKPEDLDHLDDTERHAMVLGVIQGLSKGSSYEAKTFDLGDGRQATALVDRTGRNKPITIPKADITGAGEDKVALQKQKDQAAAERGLDKAIGDLQKQWQKNADPLNDAVAGRPAGTWAKEHPMDQWLGEQLRAREKAKESMSAHRPTASLPEEKPKPQLSDEQIMTGIANLKKAGHTNDEILQSMIAAGVDQDLAEKMLTE